MKKNALILLGCWMLIFNFQISAQAKSQHLGLISDLMQIKCESELKLAESIHRSDSTVVLQKYMTAYTLVNAMISQLEADMIAANSISRYKKIDKILKRDGIELGQTDDELIQKYLETIKTASAILGEKLPTSDKSFEPLTTLSTAVDITDTAVGIIKTISELKQSKVKGICQCLDGVRLAPYSDILKPKASAR
ncbi:MAG: hypothetical protein H6Q17_744 [Bacteroidetes bacterium]|nr:hypothetical protein [Bacteroidota bacterium]